MSEPARAVEVPKEEARAWVEESLRDGHELSAAVLAAAPLGRGRFRALLPPRAPQEKRREFRSGGVVGTDASNEALVRLLDDLGGRSGRCVVVEHALARRSDPWMARSALPSAFVGEHVVHWAELGSGAGAEAADAIWAGSSGYPRNAFVATAPCADLGLVDRQEAQDDVADRLVASLLAVIVSAYDAESFVVWDAP